MSSDHDDVLLTLASSCMNMSIQKKLNIDPKPTIQRPTLARQHCKLNRSRMCIVFV